MSRPLRVDMPGGIYHVTARGIERRDIVRDDTDRLNWTNLFDRIALRRHWRVYAWALMDNHYHVFLKVPFADLSAGMHDLNSGYASVYNRRHKRCGPLFQGRFKGILVEEDHHYWQLSRYVHLNPVRAGLCAIPESYPWSSCPCYFHTESAPGWLAWRAILDEYGGTPATAQKAYRAYLYEGFSGEDTSPLEEVRSSVLLGSDDFLERMRAHLKGRPYDREVPAATRLQRSIDAADVIETVCSLFSVEKAQVIRRGSRRNQPRAVAMYLCCTATNQSVRELGTIFGGISGQAVSRVANWIRKVRTQDRAIHLTLCVLERELHAKLKIAT